MNIEEIVRLYSVGLISNEEARAMLLKYQLVPPDILKLKTVLK